MSFFDNPFRVLGGFLFADEQYRRRCTAAEDDYRKGNPNPHREAGWFGRCDSRIDRDCRLNRELCRGIAALGADGECMLAIRKCRKVACLQRNKDTAFARFVAVRRNRVAVHKNFGKVRVCGI